MVFPRADMHAVEDIGAVVEQLTECCSFCLVLVGVCVCLCFVVLFFLASRETSASN